MALEITRDMLVASYNLLCATPPFSEWGMPPSGEVGFRIIKTLNTRGTFHKAGKRERPTIGISRGCIGNLHSLNATMAHEMVHLHEDTRHAGRGDVKHSSKFNEFADEVCDHHSFDPKLF